MPANRRTSKVKKRRLLTLRGSLFGARERADEARSRKRWLSRNGPILMIAIMLLVAFVAAAVVGLQRLSVQKKQQAAAAAVQIPPTPDAIWDPAWPAMPRRTWPARSLEQVREAYAFAARRPDVLRSIPCFCGCMRPGVGHKSNEECYVKSRTSAGGPVWTNHGLTCGQCIDITRDVIVMTTMKQPLAAIRRAIESKYGPH